MLDPAILRPGRFDQIVEIPLPDEQGRRQIFEVHLRNKPLAPGIDLGSLAAATEEFSGAEIQGICVRAALSAVRRAVASKIEKPAAAVVVVIEASDLEAELEEARRL
jgi:transitional endoplasmic reticulum ATPase